MTYPHTDSHKNVPQTVTKSLMPLIVSGMITKMKLLKLQQQYVAKNQKDGQKPKTNKLALKKALLTQI
jgi:hypothetical protein